MNLHQNIVRLQVVANALDDLLPQVVFIGGAIVGMYSTRTAAAEVRFTDDIDCIIELASYGAYARLEEKLRLKGFRNSFQSHIQVRWEIQGIIIDIMPTDPNILGFSNKWYSPGMSAAQVFTLPNQTDVRILDAPHFIATKLEALKSRGEDLRWDSDFEDIVFIVDHRPELITEIDHSGPELKMYLQEEFKQLASRAVIREAIEAVMDRGANARQLLGRFLEIATLP